MFKSQLQSIDAQGIFLLDSPSPILEEFPFFT